MARFPFRRTRFSGSKGLPLRRSKKSKPTTKTLDKRIKRINKRQELRWVDRVDNAMPIVATPVLHLLNGTTKGDNVYATRQADEFYMTSFQIRYEVLTSGNVLANTIVRVVIVYDRQSNGAAATAATIFDETNDTNVVYCPYNRDYQKRYKILYDKTVEINPLAVAATTVASGVVTAMIPASRFIHKKRRIAKTVKCIQTSNTGLIADIEMGAVYLCAFSDQGAGNAPQVVYHSRIYYKDD